MNSNPFATRYVRPGMLSYRFADSDAPQHALDPTRQQDQIIQPLIQSGRGLVVGPHGSGKSTLLQNLAPELDQHFRGVARFQLCRVGGSAWSRWSDQRDIARRLHEQVQRSERHSLVVIDGAEQLGGWRLRRLGRAARFRDVAILATSHRPLAGFPILHQTNVTRALVTQLASELTQHQSVAVQALVARTLSERTITPQSNVRELFFDLYDVVHDHAHRKRLNEETATRSKFSRQQDPAIPVA